MQIAIRIQKIDVAAAFQAYIDRRLRFALGRVGHRIRRVSVRITDENGPRGGLDKGCHIRVELIPTGHIEVTDVSTDLYTAIDWAAERAGRSVARELERARDLRRGQGTNSVLGSRSDKYRVTARTGNPQ